jgi:hypothetical protein
MANTMINRYVYYSIMDYEWLQPPGDVGTILVYYSIADDEYSSKNRIDSCLAVKLTKNAEIKASLEDQYEKTLAVIAFVQDLIEHSLIDNVEIPAQITISSSENRFPLNMVGMDLHIEKWKAVAAHRRLGYL